MLCPGLNFPVRLDVFENNLYWVSEEKGTLNVMDKFGRGVNKTLQSGLVRPHAVRVMHVRKYNLTSELMKLLTVMPARWKIHPAL
jgi:hypothetical protein